MSEVWIAVAASILGMVAMWILGWARTFLARRVRVETPEARAIKGLARTIKGSMAVQDAIMDAQILQSKTLRTLLEAAQGKVNGNVEKAIGMIDAADSQFNAFLRSRVRSDFDDVEDAEEGTEK